MSADTNPDAQTETWASRPKVVPLSLDRHATLLFQNAEESFAFAEAHISKARNSLAELRDHLSGR